MINKILVSFVLLFFSFSGFSEELKYVSVEFPPYTYQTPSGGAGAMYDVAMEISKRLGSKADIQFIPWARARYQAETSSNVIIMPLARTAEREEKYTWLIHVLDDPYVLVSLKNSKHNITTLESARNLKVGILATSVADVLVRQMGFTNVESVSSDVQNVKKLKLGRIDAWVAPYSCRGRYNVEGGLDVTDVRTGLELTMLHEYLGASKNLDPKTVKLWQQTFAAMKADGTYAAIMKKYGMKPLE